MFVVGRSAVSAVPVSFDPKSHSLLVVIRWVAVGLDMRPGGEDVTARHAPREVDETMVAPLL